MIASCLDHVVLRGPAGVPDGREMLHLVRVRLADVRRVYDYQGVLVDEPLRIVHDRVLKVFGEAFRLEVSAKAALDVAVLVPGVYDTRDVGKDCVAGSLYAVYQEERTAFSV